MKKILLIIAAGLISATAMAQPGPTHDRPGMNRHHGHAMKHRKHKVWVPTHREHGRLVRGHYVYR
ncbi:MAG: hypothetical protein EOO28_15550 [Comamonadaceae bacterium]|nr:MAG: hypothetical protein EOO28_15550 [Comamonadaceae bacterium]